MNTRCAVLTVGSLSVALGTWLCMALGELSWRALFGALGLWTFVCWFGVCAAGLIFKDKRALDPVFAAALGFYSVSMLLFIGTVVLRLDVLVSLSVCVLLLGLLAYKARTRDVYRRLELPVPAMFALLVAILFTSFWSRQSLIGVFLTPTSAMSVPWLDAFYHSMYISHFARGAGKVLGTDPLLAASPLPVYHYAAYIIPSLLVRCTGIPAYISAVAVFAPVGMLLTGLTAYSFGRTLFGPIAGLLAVVLCLALPDPSFYVVGNRWLSYFFFQQIAGNGAMGCALMLLAWTFCMRGVADKERLYTLIGLVTAACVVCFKSQIFLTYSFGLLLFAALTLPRTPRAWRWGLGVLASSAFGFCALRLLPSIPRAPTLRLATTAGPANLSFSLVGLPACRRCIDQLVQDYTTFLPFGAIAFLALIFGVLAPLALLLASSHRVRTALPQGSMWFFYTACLNYLVVTLGMDLNASHGDQFEIVHKTFVWPYLAIGAWCGCALAAWLGTRSLVTRQLALATGLPLLLLGLGGHVIDCADRLQTELILEGFTNNRIERGAFDAAVYIREHAPKNAVVQPGKVDGRLMLMFQSLSDRNTYVGYAQHGRIATELTDRAFDEVASLMNAASAADVRMLARKLQVDYLVLYPGQRSPWESTLRPCFQSGEYRVYRLAV